MDLARQIVAGGLEHGGPEKQVEIADVGADEVMDFRARLQPPLAIVITARVAPFLGRGDIAHRCVEPDVEEVAGRIRDLEAEIRRGPTDIPIAQTFARHQEGAFEPARTGRVERS
jgi:hypothetical protein